MIRWAMLGMIAVAAPAAAETVRVTDAASLAAASARARPGDVIVLAPGMWRDQRLIVSARGTADAPVFVRAEVPGATILSGASNLRVLGEHVVVSGLMFRDGASPDGDVIATDPASRGVRLTEIVVDRFTRGDRRIADTWVRLLGSGHRLDHALFVGKGNAGATVVSGGANRIDGNLFGPRPPLGGPGGESVRVEAPGTIVERNRFDRTDGGPEIVTMLAGGTVVRGNAILNSRGGIAVRGGSGSVVERNVVRAGAKPGSAGIRVTAAGQNVRDNYLDRVAGQGALAAIAAEAPATITHNTVIDSARVVLAAPGSFADNLIRSTLDALRFGAAAPVLSGNVSSFDPPPRAGAGVVRDARDFVATRAGFAYLDGRDAGVPRDLVALGRAEVGPAWYVPAAPVRDFPPSVEVDVPPGDLVAAVEAAPVGATLRLKPGTYRLARAAIVARPVTIHGPADARIRFTGTTAFQLADGGNLRVEGVTLSGADAPRRAGNALVRAPLVPSAHNYTVMLDHVTLRDFAKAPRFDIVATTPGTFAERIDIRGSRITGVSGAVVAAGRMTDGFYAADLVRITKSTLVRVARASDIAARPAPDAPGPVVELTLNR